jgi:hypothetical protein
VSSVPSLRALRGAVLSSAEVERLFPHHVRLIMRGHLSYRDRGSVNEFIGSLGEHRNGSFNSIEHHRFARPDCAAAFAEYVNRRVLHRLLRDSEQCPTKEEVSAAWAAIEREREAALAWGRAKPGRLQNVIQEYRFERRQGSYSLVAHEAAARIVAKEDPAVPNPMNYAGVLIEWAEREHREWFWRCCRDHHVL